MLGFTRQDPVQPDERIQGQMQSEQQYWEEDPFGSSLPDDEPTAIPRPSFIHKVGRLIRKQIEDIGEYLILGSTVVMLGIAVAREPRWCGAKKCGAVSRGPRRNQLTGRARGLGGWGQCRPAL
jgi:hypothetical protein